MIRPPCYKYIVPMYYQTKPSKSPEEGKSHYRCLKHTTEYSTQRRIVKKNKHATYFYLGYAVVIISNAEFFFECNVNNVM